MTDDRLQEEPCHCRIIYSSCIRCISNNIRSLIMGICGIDSNQSEGNGTGKRPNVTGTPFYVSNLRLSGYLDIGDSQQ